MSNIELLREQWLWNREVRSIFLFIVFLSGVICTLFLYSSMGPNAIAAGFLTFILIGTIIGCIYGYVGKKVLKLKKSLDYPDGEIGEGLMQIGNIQSPGFIIMNENELVLVPLVGNRLFIPFSDIQSVRETWNMYGKGFLWKRTFLISAPQNRRIAFALGPSLANRWRIRLLRGGGQHV